MMSNNIETFEIVPIQEVGTIKWNFEALKMELEEILEQYRGLVYTEHTKKDAKKDRADLNKLKKEIQAKQKQCKEACLAPYKAIEDDIKELIEMVEKQSAEVDECVKTFEENAKAKKRIDIKEYYDIKAKPLGKLADRLYSKIYNPKWENATVKEKNYQEDIVITVNKLIADLRQVDKIEGPFKDDLIETYCNTTSIDEVIKKNDELMAVLNKAKVSAEDIVVESKGALIEEQDNTEDGHSIKIIGNQNQIKQILDFIKIIGAEYEEI